MTQGSKNGGKEGKNTETSLFLSQKNVHVTSKPPQYKEIYILFSRVIVRSLKSSLWLVIEPSIRSLFPRLFFVLTDDGREG